LETATNLLRTKRKYTKTHKKQDTEWPCRKNMQNVYTKDPMPYPKPTGPSSIAFYMLMCR